MSESSSSSATESDSENYEVEKIIDHRVDPRGRRRYLIQWRGYRPDDNTWEDEDNLNCPDILKDYLQMVKQTQKAIAPKGRLIERPIRVTGMIRGRDNVVCYEVEYPNQTNEVLPSFELLKIHPSLLIEYLEERGLLLPVNRSLND
jgi:hypothetical protein